MREPEIGCRRFPVGQSRDYQRFRVAEVRKTLYQPPELRTLARWRESAFQGFELTLVGGRVGFPAVAGR